MLTASQPGYQETLSGLLTAHVVARHPILSDIQNGFYCRICLEPFQVFLWPHDECVVSCDCPCTCWSAS